MNYHQFANPNATNSELDAKRVVCYEDNRVIDCKELQQHYTEEMLTTLEELSNE